MAESNTAFSFASLKQLYLNGQYGEALELMRQNREKFDAGVFHYNLGALHLKRDEPAVARYHLEKARQEGLIGPKTSRNLQTAKTKLEASGVPTGPSGGFDLVFQMPFDFYLALSLAALLAVLVFAYRQLLKSFRATAVGLAVAVVPVVFYFLVVQHYQYAVSLDSVRVFEGPSQIFEQTQKIPAGAKVLVRRPKDGWFYVRSPLSYSGWVQRENLGVL